MENLIANQSRISIRRMARRHPIPKVASAYDEPWKRVRIPLRHIRLRTSESKVHQHLLIPRAAFEFEVP
jgi:hypothetical protein